MSLVLEDERIIELYWNRNEDAISETAKKYGSYCNEIAWNILHCKEDVEECVNDAYFHTWEAIPPQWPKIFIAFLGKIARNQSLDKYKYLTREKRGHGSVPLVLDELEDCITSDINIEKEYEITVITDLINEFLTTLNEVERFIFVRRYWYLDTISIIASRSLKSENNVKSILFRIRKKLKATLNKEGVHI